jgi:hypothetical protein
MASPRYHVNAVRHRAAIFQTFWFELTILLTMRYLAKGPTKANIGLAQQWWWPEVVVLALFENATMVGCANLERAA